jgi:hypothetical protein
VNLLPGPNGPIHRLLLLQAADVSNVIQCRPETELTGFILPFSAGDDLLISSSLIA